MKTISSLLLILFAVSGNTQPTTKCNLEKVRIADERANHLTNRIVREFLLTFDSTCNTYVEFLEYSNEILFKLIESDPKRVFKSIEQHKREFDEDFIYSIVENPISDNIDLERIKDRIQQLKCRCQSKVRFLEALEAAIKKTGN